MRMEINGMPMRLRYILNGEEVDAADCVDGVLIDPVQAPEWDIRNEERPPYEIYAWWRRPYITTNNMNAPFDVYCLDGGAWDRPTMIGRKETLAEAVEMAKAYSPVAHKAYVSTHVG